MATALGCGLSSLPTLHTRSAHREDYLPTLAGLVGPKAGVPILLVFFQTECPSTSAHTLECRNAGGNVIRSCALGIQMGSFKQSSASFPISSTPQCDASKAQYPAFWFLFIFQIVPSSATPSGTPELIHFLPPTDDVLRSSFLTVNAKQCDTLSGKLAGDVSCRFQVVMWSERDESKTLQHAASSDDGLSENDDDDVDGDASDDENDVVDIALTLDVKVSLGNTLKSQSFIQGKGSEKANKTQGRFLKLHMERAGLGVPEWRFDCGSGSIGTRRGANPPEIDVQMAKMVSNLMEHNRVTSTGGGTILLPAQLSVFQVHLHLPIHFIKMVLVKSRGNFQPEDRASMSTESPALFPCIVVNSTLSSYVANQEPSGLGPFHYNRNLSPHLSKLPFCSNFLHFRSYRINLQQPPQSLQSKVVPPPTLKMQTVMVPPTVESNPEQPMTCTPEAHMVETSPETTWAMITDASPLMSVELASGSPGTLSPQPSCVRLGGENLPVISKDWGNEHCSNEGRTPFIQVSCPPRADVHIHLYLDDELRRAEAEEMEEAEEQEEEEEAEEAEEEEEEQKKREYREEMTMRGEKEEKAEFVIFTLFLIIRPEDDHRADQKETEETWFVLTSQTPKAHGSGFECSKARIVAGNTEKSLKAELYMRLWGEVKSRVWNSEVILGRSTTVVLYVDRDSANFLAMPLYTKWLLFAGPAGTNYGKHCSLNGCRYRFCSSRVKKKRYIREQVTILFCSSEDFTVDGVTMVEHVCKSQHGEALLRLWEAGLPLEDSEVSLNAPYNLSRYFLTTILLVCGCESLSPASPLAALLRVVAAGIIVLKQQKRNFPRPCPPPVASLLFEFTVPSLLQNLERSSCESVQAWYFQCMCAEKKPIVLPEDCGSEDREQRKVLTQSNNDMNGNIDLRSVIPRHSLLRHPPHPTFPRILRNSPLARSPVEFEGDISDSISPPPPPPPPPRSSSPSSPDKAALGVWITWQVSGSPLSSLKTASGEENSSPELVPDVFAQIMRQLARVAVERDASNHSITETGDNEIEGRARREWVDSNKLKERISKKKIETLRFDNMIRWNRNDGLSEHQSLSLENLAWAITVLGTCPFGRLCEEEGPEQTLRHLCCQLRGA
ncbi:hypothetical protein U0070_015539 [Myodes glareolus]|uniref:Uncharacterized protein n=1 Tax=Myodes glareolus TaxID=447135 RepID=A0AAW0IG77_MYOGA